MGGENLLRVVVIVVVVYPLCVANYFLPRDPRDNMVLVHNRLTGVPPNAETLSKMVKLYEKHKTTEALALAIENPNFYNLVLRRMFSAWSNVTGDVGVDLNDMVATMIGIVRDDIPFTEALSGDILYTGKEQGQVGGAEASQMYSLSDNNHYLTIQDKNLKEVLQKGTQSGMQGALPAEAIAGVLSTRAFGEAFFSAGTNRRATAFVLKNFLCHEMEELHDITAMSESFIRQDVDRSDTELFKARCKGCHAGMDALSGWNVHYDFVDAGLQYKFYPQMGEWENLEGDEPNDRQTYESNQNKVAYKIIRNRDTFRDGFNYIKQENANDEFRNLWTEGQNASLGWQGKTTGRGAKEWGEMIARTEAFSKCMATHVYEHVCFVKPDKQRSTVRDNLAAEFKKNNYNMKKLFAETAHLCLIGGL